MKASFVLLWLPVALVLAFAGGCGGETADDAVVDSVTPPAVCQDANPTEARLAFPDGEIGALAVANGELVVGARSLRVDEKGALWRVAFDGRPARQLGSGYVGGPIYVNGEAVVHAEPTDAAANGHLVVTSFDGSRHVVEGPSLVLGEFDVVRGQAFFFGRENAGIALWSYDPANRDAVPERIAEETGGGLFSNGSDLLQAFATGDAQTVHIRRFDRSTRAFVEVTSYPVFERGVVGADARSVYLHDAPTRTIVSVDLITGQDTRTLAHDLDATIGGAHLTDDALYVFQTSTRRLVRIDKTTTEQTVVTELPDSAFIHAFASDGCYVYAAVDGARAIVRIPRR